MKNIYALHLEYNSDLMKSNSVRFSALIVSDLFNLEYGGILLHPDNSDSFIENTLKIDLKAAYIFYEEWKKACQLLGNNISTAIERKRVIRS